jgi:hypothetical protein
MRGPARPAMGSPTARTGAASPPRVTRDQRRAMVRNRERVCSQRREREQRHAADPMSNAQRPASSPAGARDGASLGVALGGWGRAPACPSPAVDHRPWPRRGGRRAGPATRPRGGRRGAPRCRLGSHAPEHTPRDPKSCARWSAGVSSIRAVDACGAIGAPSPPEDGGRRPRAPPPPHPVVVEPVRLP